MNPVTELDRVVARIRDGRRFLVSSHQRPDGDAIGSAMAMVLALRVMGKEAEAVMDAVPPVFLRPFPGVDGVHITTESRDTADAALIMECSDLSRTGVTGLDRSPVVNIDHHPGNTRYGTINWIDESAAACGEMVCAVIDALGVPLDPAIATHVFLAILTDTGSFHFSHMTPRTFEIAGRCVGAGADPQWIARTHYDSNSLGRVRLFGAVMSAMTLHAGRVALLSLGARQMSALGATEDDTDGLINFPLTVKEIEAVGFFKEVGGGAWRLSLRSKGAVDIGAVARQFGGGGHRNAAGCSLQGDLASLQATVAALLVAAVDAASANSGRAHT